MFDEQRKTKQTMEIKVAFWFHQNTQSALDALQSEILDPDAVPAGISLLIRARFGR